MTRWEYDNDGHLVRAADSPPLTDKEKADIRHRARFIDGSGSIYQSASENHRDMQLAFLALEAEREANGVPGPSEAPRVATSEDVKPGRRRP